MVRRDLRTYQYPGGDILGVVQYKLTGPTGELAGSFVLSAMAALDMALRTVGVAAKMRRETDRDTFNRGE